MLDRTKGELLLGKPFVKKLTWASGIGADGRPQLLEGNRPTREGSKTCPAVRGATNWYSTAFNPETHLFYLMAVEDCTIYRQDPHGGYVPYRDPSDPPGKYLRALDINTAKSPGRSHKLARRNSIIPECSPLPAISSSTEKPAVASPQWMRKTEDLYGTSRPASNGGPPP